MAFKDILIEKLKKNGIHLAEQEAVLITKAIFETTNEVVAEAAPSSAGFVKSCLDYVETAILKLEDKIDGIEGNS